MSPHAVPEASSRGGSSVDLTEFAVTRNAFLPERRPLQKLPDPYYQPWESIAKHLPALIESNRIRQAVAALPVLSTARLSSEPEWRRAYMMLAFIANAHVWGGEEPDEILPPQISIPFLRAAEHLELPPVLTFAAACLWNFACAGDDSSKVEDLSPLCSFTGTDSESWFIIISVAMEAKAAGIIHTMMGALAAAKTRDLPIITEALHDLRRCIQEIGALLDRIYERCDTLVFYHEIRPFLAGSRNMEAAGLHRGVFYDEGNGKGEWRQLRGGSNGQSSLIQFFDIMLGVEHPNHDAGEASYHAEMREYMPGPHRRFLVHVTRMGSIRELALAPQTTDEQCRLRAAYVAATQALGAFRNKHLQVVARYIIVPSRQKQPASPDSETRRWRQNLASSSSLQLADDGLMGTGGTRLVPFLKEARDVTCRAGQQEV